METRYGYKTHSGNRNHTGGTLYYTEEQARQALQIAMGFPPEPGLEIFGAIYEITVEAAWAERPLYIVKAWAEEPTKG